MPRRLARLTYFRHYVTVGDEAVTIAEAAAVLGVSRPRIHQLLNAGVLTGRKIETTRAPAGALRVSRASLVAEVERRRRVKEGAKVRTDPGDARGSSKGDAADRGSKTRRDRRGDSATAAALRMKIALDQARDALKHERAQTAKVTRVLAETVAMLQEQQRLTQQADDLAARYADAVTQLLTPTDLGEM